jgi:hypothetical protein
MNKFGLEEIRAIRDRWDAMPYEEALAERKESFLKVMKESYGENWQTTVRVITPSQL